MTTPINAPGREIPTITGRTRWASPLIVPEVRQASRLIIDPTERSIPPVSIVRVAEAHERKVGGLLEDVPQIGYGGEAVGEESAGREEQEQQGGNADRPDLVAKHPAGA